MPRKGQKYTPSPGQPWGAGKKFAAFICVVIFFIGMALAISGWSTQTSTDPNLTVDERISGGHRVMWGIGLMIAPIALAMGLSSGTGRPYGGRRYKGGPSF